MKKNVIGLAVLTLLFIAAPAYAQTNAQYCFGSSPFTCQYLADTALEQGTTYWGYSAGSGPVTVTDPCASGAGSTTTKAADLDPGDSVFQNFNTDSFPAWSLRLDLYKTSTSVTANDYFTIYVRNYSTNQVETHYVSAGDYPGLCGGAISLNLTNNYSNAHVRVRIQKSYGATATMYVDNVAFFGKSF